VEVDPDERLLANTEINLVATGELPAHHVRLLAASPNPFNPRCRIAWETDMATRDELAIYDLQGRRVARRDWSLRSSGLRSFTWEGSDDRGHDCASGVYVFVIHCREDRGTNPGAAASHRLSGKITLDR
jgi:hypothetical protein